MTNFTTTLRVPKQRSTVRRSFRLNKQYPLFPPDTETYGSYQDIIQVREKIRNPLTGRMVYKSGVVYRDTTTNQREKVRNPLTGRMVYKCGVVGRSLATTMMKKTIVREFEEIKPNVIELNYFEMMKQKMMKEEEVKMKDEEETEDPVDKLRRLIEEGNEMVRVARRKLDGMNTTVKIVR